MKMSTIYPIIEMIGRDPIVCLTHKQGLHNRAVPKSTFSKNWSEDYIRYMSCDITKITLEASRQRRKGEPTSAKKTVKLSKKP